MTVNPKRSRAVIRKAQDLAGYTAFTRDLSVNRRSEGRMFFVPREIESGSRQVQKSFAQMAYWHPAPSFSSPHGAIGSLLDELA